MNEVADTWKLPSLSILIVGVAVSVLLLFSVMRRIGKIRKGEKLTLKSFFLMDQDASVLLLTVSYCATLLSAFTFVGLPGFFYTHGVGTWLFIPFSNVSAVLLFYFFGRLFRRLQSEYNTYSPFEIIGKAYKSKWLAFTTFCISVIFIIPHLSVQIAGFGKLAAGLGLNYETATLALILVFAGYTVFAGMWGDVWTDFWQAVLMLGGLWVVCVLLLGNWNFNIESLFQQIIDTRGRKILSLPGPYGFFTHLGLISYIIMFISVTVVQAPYAMRILIAKGENELRGATKYIPILLFAFFVPTLVIGLSGAALYPNLDSGDHLIGRVLLGLFGSGSIASALVLGVILSAMTFAVISTIDSQLLALGATFARDVYKAKVNPDAKDSSEIKVSRIVMLGVALLAYIVSLNPPRLIVQLSILSVAGTLQLLPTFLGAVLTRRKPRLISAYVSLFVGFSVFGSIQWGLVSTTLFGGIHSGFLGLVAGTIALLITEWIIRSSEKDVFR